jgi:hypothetical protein
MTAFSENLTSVAFASASDMHVFKSSFEETFLKAAAALELDESSSLVFFVKSITDATVRRPNPNLRTLSRA